ncbi:MAG: hypothetical protein AB1700_04640 [Bacillota bacterium]
MTSSIRSLPGPLTPLFERDNVIVTPQKRVGRLDPDRNTVTSFEKPGVLPQDVAAIGQVGLPALVAVADGNSFTDVLCVEKEFGRHSRIGMVDYDSFVARVEQLRKIGPMPGRS